MTSKAIAPRIIIAIVLLAALALLLYKTLRPGIEAGSGDASLETRVTRMEAQQQEMLELLRGRRPQNAAGGAMSPQAMGLPMSGPQGALATPGKGENDFKQLAAAHARERVDAAWAPTAERQLTEASKSFGNSGLPEPANMDVGCRAQSCQITARFAKRGDAEDWILLLITQSAPTFLQARQTIVAMPDGSFEARILGSRR